MRILHVNEHDKPGGAETTIAELKEGLERRGVQNESYILADVDGKIISTEITFWKAMHNFQPDIIHLHNIGIQSAILDWVLETKLPLVWTLHDYWPFCTTRMTFWGGRLCPIPCDYRCGEHREGVKEFIELGKVITLVENPTSQWIFEQYGIYPKLIACGVDLDKWKYGTNGTNGTKSRKGIFFTQADPHAWWKGEKIAKRIIAKLGEQAISVRGTVEQVAEAMASCKIALIPSLYPETFCRIAMEAKACGTVSVAFSVAGLAYQIKDGETGFLAKMGDEIELLEKAKLALEVDEDFRQRLRRDVEENWSLNKMVDEYLEVYNAKLHK